MPSIDITTELCEFVGAIIGDGNLWTDGSRFRVELTGDPNLDKEYYCHFSAIAETLFNKKPYPVRFRQRGLRWRLQSKEAFSILKSLELPAGTGKAHRVEIPKSIIEKGWNYVKWTLRGIMDTDGTLFYSKKTYSKPIYPTIELRTCSRKLAEQMENILNQQEFRARKRGNEKEGFHVALYGMRMLEKWTAEIGFSNPKHSNKLIFRKL